MSLGLYIHGHSFLHRLPAGAKVLGLVAAGTLLFLVADWRWLAAALLATLFLYAFAGIPWRQTLAQLRPLFWIMAILFLVQALIDHWMTGLVLVLRFSALILLASLVSLTTRVSTMVEALERGLRPLGFLGLDVEKVSLALSMAIRFIPLVGEQLREVRDAQRARGLDRNIVALAVPWIVRSLKMADAVAEAVEARSYEGGRKRPQSSRTP